jgi:hypothetical protein
LKLRPNASRIQILPHEINLTFRVEVGSLPNLITSSLIVPIFQYSKTPQSLVAALLMTIGFFWSAPATLFLAERVIAQPEYAINTVASVGHQGFAHPISATGHRCRNDVRVRSALPSLTTE